MHSPPFETGVEEARKREASISYEFYRLLKNAISSGVTYEATSCEFKDVIPEFPVDGKRADLVVLASRYNRELRPFLVIEVKVRAFVKPGPSTASAVRRAQSYARKLSQAPTLFYAVYDGWTLLAFRDVSPYLIKASSAIADPYKAGELLKGLEEYAYRNKSDSLDSLPKHPDLEFLRKRILPSVAMVFEKDTQGARQLVASWERLL